MAKASKQQRTQALVLHKTKLKETDLIYEVLLPGGQKMSIIGKGARKPKSLFSARMELGSLVDINYVEGRGLPILTEAQLVCVNSRIWHDFDLNLCCSCACELLRLCAHQDLEQVSLFAVSCAFFERLNDLEPGAAYTLLIAFLLKVYAYTGFKPQLDSCAICGIPRDTDKTSTSHSFDHLSFSEGGFICSSCKPEYKTEAWETQQLSWIQFLLMSPFKSLKTVQISQIPLPSLFLFCKRWAQVQLGIRLKTIDYIMDELRPIT